MSKQSNDYEPINETPINVTSDSEYESESDSDSYIDFDVYDIEKLINEKRTAEMRSKQWESFSIKFDIGVIDISKQKPFKIMVENGFSKYEKVVYNLIRNEDIQEVCKQLVEYFDAEYSDYSRYLHTSKVTAFNKSGDSTKFRELKLGIKLIHPHKKICVDFMLLHD